MNFFGRRKFIIRKKLQYSLLIISLLYVVFFLVVLGTSLFIPLMIELGKSYGSSEKALQAANQILYLHANFWPAVLFSFIVICLHSIFTSHRIAGPLYRFSLAFKDMKEGVLCKPIRVRKGDHLLDEIETFNQMVERLRAKIAEIQEAQVCFSKAITECSELVSQAPRDEIIKRLSDLTQKGNRLGEKIGFFKIESY